MKTRSILWRRLCAAVSALLAHPSELLARTVSSNELATPELSLGGSLLKTGLSLGAIIVLLLLALRLIARWNGASRRSSTVARIEVLETRRLEARRSLHVVRIEGRRWLVASCEGAMQLEPLPQDDAAPSQVSADDARAPRRKFANLFLRRDVGSEVSA